LGILDFFTFELFLNFGSFVFNKFSFKYQRTIQIYSEPNKKPLKCPPKIPSNPSIVCSNQQPPFPILPTAKKIFKIIPNSILAPKKHRSIPIEKISEKEALHKPQKEIFFHSFSNLFHSFSS